MNSNSFYFSNRNLIFEITTNKFYLEEDIKNSYLKGIAEIII